MSTTVSPNHQNGVHQINFLVFRPIFFYSHYPILTFKLAQKRNKSGDWLSEMFLNVFLTERVQVGRIEQSVD